MPVQNYGLVRGQVVARMAEADRDNPHYQICLRTVVGAFRVAVNVQSRDSLHPELLYYVADPFLHPLTQRLLPLRDDFYPLPTIFGGMHSPLALDYVRGSLLELRLMRPLPHNVPGPQNDLNEKIDSYVEQAMVSANGAHPASVFAYGSRWGPEVGRADTVFGFVPGNGMHNVHLNQGNLPGQHEADNGVYQDGGLIFHFPAPHSGASGRFVALFLAFQSQTV